MTSSTSASEGNNIFYEFNEIQSKDAEKVNVTYEELLANVNSTVGKLSSSDSETDIGMMMSDYVAQELNYNENYTLRQLYRIAEYYDISKRKKKKTELIEEIVVFENQPENCEIVNRRATLWSYMEEIKQDKYLSKFLILE
tara:strand:- start:265 stop:687 length:423 start_codon:yes stop_codon:yes gene_type:complete